MSKKSKKLWKIAKIVLISALVLAVLAVGLYFFLLFHGLTKNQSTEDLTEYESYLNTDEHYDEAQDYMPALKDCGEYRGGTVSLRRHRSMFSFNSYALFLDYDAEEYEAQKKAIQERQRFLTETTDVYRDVDAEWNGFSVRPVLLNEDWDKYESVKTNLFIGFDDEAHRILYACFGDNELDEIDDLNETLDYYFFCPKQLKK